MLGGSRQGEMPQECSWVHQALAVSAALGGNARVEQVGGMLCWHRGRWYALQRIWGRQEGHLTSCPSLHTGGTCTQLRCSAWARSMHLLTANTGQQCSSALHSPVGHHGSASTKRQPALDNISQSQQAGVQVGTHCAESMMLMFWV